MLRSVPGTKYRSPDAGEELSDEVQTAKRIKLKSRRAKNCPGEDFKVPKELFPSVLFCFEGERGKG